MREVVIVAAVRTPMGKYGGALKDVRPDDLAALVIREVVRRAGIDPAMVDEVYMGCANQAGEDNRNVARMAAILAGFPYHVAAVTVNRLCASGSPPSTWRPGPSAAARRMWWWRAAWRA
jgi:acetyl-CoA acetyltransferase